MHVPLKTCNNVHGPCKMIHSRIEVAHLRQPSERARQRSSKKRVMRGTLTMPIHQQLHRSIMVGFETISDLGPRFPCKQR